MGDLSGAADDQLGRDGDLERRAVVAVEAGERERGGLVAEAPGVGAHDGGAEQVGELEVVEADQRDGRAIRERVQRAHRVAVVGGEDRGRPARVGQREQALDARLRGDRVVVAAGDQHGILRQSGGLERLAVAGQALAHRVEVRHVTHAGDPRVAVRDQVLDRPAGAAEVVEQHGVGLDALGRAVEEDGAGHVGDVAVVGAGGHDQQRVDAAPQQRTHEFALALGVLERGGRDQQEPALAGDGLDGLGDGGVERVGDVLDHEPERGGGAALAQ